VDQLIGGFNKLFGGLVADYNAITHQNIQAPQIPSIADNVAGDAASWLFKLEGVERFDPGNMLPKIAGSAPGKSTGQSQHSNAAPQAVHYSPVININGGATPDELRRIAEKIAEQMRRDFEQMMQSMGKGGGSYLGFPSGVY
jgi:hypothetical protein